MLPPPFTPPALRPAVERALLSRLAADGGVLTTGFVTFPYMLGVLADLAPAAGQALLTQRGAGESGPWRNSAGSSNSLCKEQWDGGDAEMPSLCGPLAAWSFYSHNFFPRECIILCIQFSRSSLSFLNMLELSRQHS